MVVHAIQIRGDEYVVHSYHLLKSGYSRVCVPFQLFTSDGIGLGLSRRYKCT